MRPFVVVNVTELIQASLRMAEVRVEAIPEGLGFEGAVKAFDFSLRLRMMRAPVNNIDAQPHEPYRQACMGSLGLVAPRAAVVGEDLLWKTIECEHTFE